MNQNAGQLGHSVTLVLMDDQSNAETAASVVRDMLQANTVDVFIGPTTYSASKMVVEVINGAKTLVLWSADSDDLYSLGYRNIFNFAVPTSRHMNSALEALHGFGARSVAITSFHGGAWKKMCQGARLQAAQLNMREVGVFDGWRRSREDVVNETVSVLNGAQVDAMVSCGSSADLEMLVSQRESLSVNAFLSTQVARTRFREKFINAGQGNATAGMLMPLQAGFCIGDALADPALDWGFTEFMNEYRWVHMEPPERVFVVTGAVITITNAMVKAGNDVSKLEQAMYDIDIYTLIGRIRFYPNGTTRDRVCTVFQTTPVYLINGKPWSPSFPVYPKSCAASSLIYPIDDIFLRSSHDADDNPNAHTSANNGSLVTTTAFTPQVRATSPPGVRRVPATTTTLSAQLSETSVAPQFTNGASKPYLGAIVTLMLGILIGQHCRR